MRTNVEESGVKASIAAGRLVWLQVSPVEVAWETEVWEELDREVARRSTRSIDLQVR